MDRRAPFSLLSLVMMSAVACSHPEAHAPVQMVKVDADAFAAARPPPCHCDEDLPYEPALIEDEDDSQTVKVKAAPVEYVPMGEWQPPESVQRIEAEIVPRGDDPPTYIRFPQLKLHRPMSETGTVHRYRH